MKTTRTTNLKILTLPKEKRFPEKYNSHTSFSRMLILVQTFGFFPVQGISGPDFRSLNFTWKSVRVVYAVLTILGSTFITVMQLYKIVGKGLDLREAFRFSMNFSGLISGCLFLNLAKNWPVLMKNWSTVDLSMLNYGWPAVLNRKLNILVTVFMGAALSKAKSTFDVSLFYHNFS
jgi:gustatory receptor